MGFSTAQGSTVHARGVLKIENFVPCDMISFFLRIIGDFLLNNGVDIKE